MQNADYWCLKLLFVRLVLKTFNMAVN